jgi:hypothetical protein
MLEMIISLLLAQIAPEDQVEPMPTGRTVGPWIELVDMTTIGATSYWARLDAASDEGVVSIEFGGDRPTLMDLESELSD